MNQREWKSIIFILILVLFGTIKYLFDLSLTRKNSNLFNNKILLVIPGGGLLRNGSLPLHSIARMNKAINLYWSLKQEKENPIIITLSAGTTHKPPPLDKQSFPIYESSAGIEYLISHNIPITDLIEEKLSLDTIGNVFSLFIFILFFFFFKLTYNLGLLSSYNSYRIKWF